MLSQKAGDEEGDVLHPLATRPRPPPRPLDVRSLSFKDLWFRGPVKRFSFFFLFFSGFMAEL